MSYQIHEVDGVTFSDTSNAFNKLVPEWPVPQQRHFTRGYWWLALFGDGAMSDLRPQSDQQRTWTGLLKAIRHPHDP